MLQWTVRTLTCITGFQNSLLLPHFGRYLMHRGPKIHHVDSVHHQSRLPGYQQKCHIYLESLVLWAFHPEIKWKETFNFSKSNRYFSIKQYIILAISLHIYLHGINNWPHYPDNITDTSQRRQWEISYENSDYLENEAFFMTSYLLPICKTVVYFMILKTKYKCFSCHNKQNICMIRRKTNKINVIWLNKLYSTDTQYYCGNLHVCTFPLLQLCLPNKYM